MYQNKIKIIMLWYNSSCLDKLKLISHQCNMYETTAISVSLYISKISYKMLKRLWLQPKSLGLMNSFSLQLGRRKSYLLEHRGYI